MDNNPLLKLRARGQSVWLDDIHRRLFSDGTLKRLIETDGLAGLTSNPAIFAAAIMQQPDYRQAVAQLLRQVKDSAQLYEAIVIDDIRQAADVFQPVHASSGGRDGFVSLEVSPHLAHDSQATIAEGLRLWRRLERPNVMIKVPGTRAGLEAVAELIASGVNVNVTLLFSPSRYRAVADAYLSGLEQRLRRSEPVTAIDSVASFFVSRIDTLVDRLLDEHAGQGRGEARSLRGRTSVACASRAYDIYREITASARWQALAQRGARPQRLLWASTSTKDPHYADVKYVEELLAPETVNTLPLATLEAYRDHGKLGPGLSASREDSARVLRELAHLGIDIERAAEQLESEAVAKFVEPFDRLQRWLDEQRGS
jgi:transaldolase